MSRLDLSSSLFGLSIPVSGIFWNLDWVMNHLGDWSLFPALHCLQINFPGGSDSKESSCNVGDLSLIPESGRSPGEGHGNPLQYSCLENPIDRGAQWAAVPGVAKSRT